MKALNNADIYKSLMNIAKTTFPDLKIESFTLKLVNEENFKFHGIYYFPHVNKWKQYKKGYIKLYNLTRDPQYVICTAIHELAHHCDFMMRKTSDHTKKFYTVYAQLLKTSIELNYINYAVARKATDVGDIYQLEKWHKDVIDIIPKENTNIKIIKIFRTYAQGKILKSKNYIYSNIEKCWTLEIEKKNIREEAKKLMQFFEKEEIKVFDKEQINFEAKATIVIKIIKPEFMSLNLKLKESKNYKYNQDAKQWEKLILKINQKWELERLYQNGINDDTASIKIK